MRLPKHESPRAKLDFTPIGEERTLLDLLRRIRLGKPYAVDSLGDYFELSGFIDSAGEDCLPSLYCDMLPTNARGLFNLYEAVGQFVGSQPCESSKLSGPDLAKLLKQVAE